MILSCHAQLWAHKSGCKHGYPSGRCHLQTYWPFHPGPHSHILCKGSLSLPPTSRTWSWSVLISCQQASIPASRSECVCPREAEFEVDQCEDLLAVARSAQHVQRSITAVAETPNVTAAMNGKSGIAPEKSIPS